MKKRIVIISFIIISITCLLAILIFNSRRDLNNGFKRKSIQPKIEIANVFKLPDQSFSFADKSSDDIILTSYKEPLALFRIDLSLSKLKKIALRAPVAFNAKSNYIKFDIRYSYICLSNTEGDIATLHNGITNTFKIPINNSDQALAISPSRLIVRSLEKKGQERNMALEKLMLSKKTIRKKKYVLTKYAGGFFGNDGKLRYAEEHSRLFYLYSYLGEFLCLDTNLNLIYTGKTIDTVTVPKIKLGSFKITLGNGKQANKITQAAPPRFVNRSFTTNKSYLYILSGLKADNEKASFFYDNQPIDVYSIKDGRYLHSFYIPRYKKYKIRKLEVRDNLLVALFDKYLVTFTFKE